MSRLLLRILAVLLLSAPFAAQEETLAFVDVQVVPMDTERLLEHQTVLVAGGRITALGPVTEVEVPAGARVVPGEGRTLMPGLHDLHVHLFDEGDLAVYLAHGVTSVRNLMGTPWHLELRERIEKGELLGPHFQTSGPFVNEPEVVTQVQAMRAAKEQAAAGYDCIKIHGRMQRDTYEALVAAAKREGIPIVGHVPRNLEVEAVLSGGGHADISHAEEYLYTYFDRGEIEWSDESIADIAAQTWESEVAVVPNLIAYHLITAQIEDLDAVLAQPELAYVAPFPRKSWGRGYNKYERDFDMGDVPRLRQRFQFLQRLTKGLADAGVVLLLGSDAMNPTAVPGASAHQELALLVESGLTPYQALRSATTDAATHLSGKPAAGTVAAGEAADLLLVAGNPLEDVARAGHVEGVVLAGRWLPRATLETSFQELLERYAIEERFTDLAGIADATDAVAYYRERKAEDPEAFVFRAGGAACMTLMYAHLGSDRASAQIAELLAGEYPESSRAHALHAEALLRLGERLEAGAAYERALELSPDDERLAAALEELAE